MTHKLAIAIPWLLLVTPTGVAAQGHAGHSQHVGKEGREVKALAPERVQALLAGEGAGYALPAELNGYPGPRHVLDLRQELELSEEQIRRTTGIFEGMQSRARELGQRLIEAETELERAFRSGDVTADALEGLTARAADLDGELRRVHLTAHIETRALLTPEQIARYDELRGYGGEDGAAAEKVFE